MGGNKATEAKLRALATGDSGVLPMLDVPAYEPAEAPHTLEGTGGGYRQVNCVLVGTTGPPGFQGPAGRGRRSILQYAGEQGNSFGNGIEAWAKQPDTSDAAECEYA